MRPALLAAGPAAPPLPEPLGHHQLRGDGVVVVEGGAVPRRGVGGVRQGGFVPGLDIVARVGVTGEHQHGLVTLCLTSQYSS